MKVLSLNIWGGRVRSPLLKFIGKRSDVDVFCFQEVYLKAKEQISTETTPYYALDIFSELEAQLPTHRGFFRPVVGENYGIGMFVKKSIDVLDEGDVMIHETHSYSGRGPAHSRNLQWIKVRTSEGNEYAVLNVHGLWNGQGKKDSPERIAQSMKIRNFVDSLQIPTILCGDFNLRPDTDSVLLLEQTLENLVRKYQVTSTRTAFYPKEEKYADYFFTSSNIKINDFQVLKEEVSDHAPLLLDCN